MQAWREFADKVREGRHPEFQEHLDVFRSLDGSEAGPQPVWWPGEDELERSNLALLRDERGFATYQELHLWSVEHREEFWGRAIEALDLSFGIPPTCVLDLSVGVEQPRWLPGSRFNVVDSCFQAPADAPAIIAGSDSTERLTTVTYGELERLVNRFANGLREHGFAQDEGIALYMPMTIECVAAYLGIVRAGGCVVSVADSFSAAELTKRMEIAGSATVLTVAAYERAGRRIDLYSKVREALDSVGPQARCIVIPEEGCSPPGDLGIGDLTWDQLLSDREVFESVIGPPAATSNILFSSGTTGDPKAIPWTHLTPIKCAMDGRYHQDIREGDVVAWPTNIGWMMGPWLIYASLLNRSAIALHEGAPHTRDFIEFVDRARVTMLGLVPALVRAWRAKDLVAIDSWRHVRTFSSTGEASNAQDYLWLMSRAGYRAPVIEYLGGTEIGGGHITGSVLQPASPSTFTTPALGVDFVILDEEDQPIDDGEMGELFLIPPSLGLSQTLLHGDHHEVYFEGCPAGPNGEVLRRHGDQMARLRGGFFKVEGRTDDTMNLGGIKVSSLELERVFNSHPGIYESAAVAVRPGGEGADHLVVYVVLKDPVELEALQADLRSRLVEQLNPLFKIHELVAIDELPRTASNKVMRRKLRSAWMESGGGSSPTA